MVRGERAMGLHLVDLDVLAREPASLETLPEERGAGRADDLILIADQDQRSP